MYVHATYRSIRAYVCRYIRAANMHLHSYSITGGSSESSFSRVFALTVYSSCTLLGDAKGGDATRSWPCVSSRPHNGPVVSNQGQIWPARFSCTNIICVHIFKYIGMQSGLHESHYADLYSECWHICVQLCRHIIIHVLHI